MSGKNAFWINPYSRNDDTSGLNHSVIVINLQNFRYKQEIVTKLYDKIIYSSSNSSCSTVAHRTEFIGTLWIRMKQIFAY